MTTDREARISGVWPPQGGQSIEALLIALGGEVRKGRAEQLATHADVALIKIQNASMGTRMGIAEARLEVVEEGLATVEQKLAARDRTETERLTRELDAANRKRPAARTTWPLAALLLVLLLGVSTVALAALLLLRS